MITSIIGMKKDKRNGTCTIHGHEVSLSRTNDYRINIRTQPLYESINKTKNTERQLKHK